MTWGKNIGKVVLSQTFIMVVLLCVIGLELHSVFKDIRPVPIEQFAKERNEIEPWMSIGYINFVYKLPDSYLKENLGITSAEYPNIRLRRIADEQNISFDELRARIAKLILEYK